MDGRGGCCIARYAGGAYDMSKVDQIMLRFRPIAPKPAASGAGSSLSSISGGSAQAEKILSPGKSRRGKRRSKPVRAAGSRKKKASSSSSSSSSPEEGTKVTLPLLPETPVGKESPPPPPAVAEPPVWMKTRSGFENQKEEGVGSDRRVVMAPQAVRVIGSCVTVECVTDTWVGFSLGNTDEDRRKGLERDTCPGFMTDAWNRVAWTNGAYRRMVAGEKAEEEEENGNGNGNGMVVAWVVMKERLPWAHEAFTCRVRVQYTCGKERSGSLTLPCDVWRLDAGGFAWRLDVNAALSLGR